MKILKIERGNYCRYFNFKYSESGKWNRFKCTHPEAKRKNGNPRIINRKLALSGKFPKWCPLEDYPRKISKAEMECHKRVFGSKE